MKMSKKVTGVSWENNHINHKNNIKDFKETFFLQFHATIFKLQCESANGFQCDVSVSSAFVLLLASVTHVYPEFISGKVSPRISM